MKQTFLLAAVAAVAAIAPSLVHADVGFNAGLTSDYRYRGISQTRTKPALQAGIDYSSGAFYVGAWASNIQWIKDLGGDASIEVDLYGGYKGALTKELGLDVGVLTYQYPSNKLNPSANTTELYGALSYGPATLKYSHAVTDTFANPNSENSYYLDLSASLDIGGGFTLTPHMGYQKIKGPFADPGSYTDYALTLSKEFSGIVVSGAVVGTDADKTFYVSPVNGKELGKTTFVLGAKVNF